MPSYSYKFIIAIFCLVFISDYMYATHKQKVRSDFKRHYVASNALLAGKNIYDDTETDKEFKYSPFNAILFTPFAVLPYYVSQSLWRAINILFVLYILLYASRIVYAGRVPLFIWLIPIILTAQLFWINTKTGQINIVVLFFVMLGLYHIERKQNRTSAGIFIGIASVLKYMPIVFLLYFILTRQWRVVISFLSTLILCVIIIPCGILGVHRYKILMDTYLTEGLMRVERMVGYYTPSGHSLQIAIFKTLSGFQNDSDEIPVDSPSKPGLFSLGTAKTIARSLSLTLLCALAILIFLKYSSNDYTAYYYSLLFILMILISPEARKAHFIVLILPTMLLCYSLYLYGWKNSSIRFWALSGIIIPYILLFSLHEGIVGYIIKSFVDRFSMVAWGTLFMGISIIILMFKHPHPENLLPDHNAIASQ